MPLHSRICDILNIEYPIVLAGMGGASVRRLAAAVSNAGGARGAGRSGLFARAAARVDPGSENPDGQAIRG
ncbi:nitronate monooxygenase [Phenylobacterium sp.]|uniref:nitronate monooxygenase n=1 Tax=Phenylobacterium sp. TaxID=1871053 RepID=UPI0025F76CA6|nr:nitronate monooxygenase [Phenylobacterium sp.]